MNKERLIPVFVISMLLLSSVVFAAGTISITDITVPSSVAQGDSFTVTMSVYGSQVTDVYGSLTLPNGISCTPTGSQLISLDASGTGSASWSCTADAPGDYSNEITASVTAKDSGTGASVSDNEQTGLMVLSPASITISSTISSSSITTAGSTTFTVGVNNMGDVATTFNITLTCPSGLTCSPSSINNIDISGNSLNNSQFTITGSVGSYTITATVTSPIQSDLTTSKDLTITAAPTGGSAPSGGLPKIKVNTTKGEADITIPSISAGEMANVTIEETEDMAVTRIEISVKNSVSDIKVTIAKLAERPAEIAIAVTGKVYHYLNLSKENIEDADVSKVKIAFKVEKSWISDNNINETTIALYRWANGTWNALDTSKVSEDDDYVYFEAESPGLSYFVIRGEESVAPAEECPTCLDCTEWSDCVNNTQTKTCYNCSAETGYVCEAYTETRTCGVAPSIWPWIVGIIVVIIIVAIFALKKYKQSKPDRRP